MMDNLMDHDPILKETTVARLEGTQFPLLHDCRTSLQLKWYDIIVW